MGGTKTPKTSTIRDQVHAKLLRMLVGDSTQLGFNIQSIQGSPEGVLLGRRGDLAMDIDAGTLYIKTGPAPAAAWNPIGWVPFSGSAPASQGWEIIFTPTTVTREPAVFGTLAGSGITTVPGIVPAVISGGGLSGTSLILFEAGTPQAATFDDEIPLFYDGGTIFVDIWIAGSADADTEWGCLIEEKGLGYDISGAASYGTTVAETFSLVGPLLTQMFTFEFETPAQRDSIVAGDPFRLALYRDDGGAAGDVGLTRVRVRGGSL